MANGGLSPNRLERLQSVMSGYVERLDVPGIVTLLHRRDETHVHTFGRQGFDSRGPMRRDTLFRVASMTKPVLAVAAMMLVEETTLRMDDPVDPYLPELADRKVLRSPESAITDTVSADRSITLRDLLTLRLGIGAIMAPLGTYPIQQAFDESGLAPGPESPPFLPDEYMRRLGALPLVYQPGTHWMYHTGFEVLGVLLARATGQSLPDLLSERIFAPLGMTDTAFRVPEAQRDRVANCYGWGGSQGGATTVPENVIGSHSEPLPAAVELVSTADDYLAFGQMLLGLGKYGSIRLLARPTVELMLTDQITPEQKAASPFFPGFWDNNGWGFGMEITTRRDTIYAVPGRFGWAGGFGTLCYCDPREAMIAILMTQRSVDATVGRLFNDFWTLAYQAIDD